MFSLILCGQHERSSCRGGYCGCFGQRRDADITFLSQTRRPRLLDMRKSPHQRYGGTSCFSSVVNFTFKYMATLGLHCVVTGWNSLPVCNSRTIPWITNCHQSLHRHSGESQMGELSLSNLRVGSVKISETMAAGCLPVLPVVVQDQLVLTTTCEPTVLMP